MHFLEESNNDQIEMQVSKKEVYTKYDPDLIQAYFDPSYQRDVPTSEIMPIPETMKD